MSLAFWRARPDIDSFWASSVHGIGDESLIGACDEVRLVPVQDGGGVGGVKDVDVEDNYYVLFCAV